MDWQVSTTVVRGKIYRKGKLWIISMQHLYVHNYLFKKGLPRFGAMVKHTKSEFSVYETINPLN